MDIIKKILSKTIPIAIILGSIGTVSAAETFSDIQNFSPYLKATSYLYENEIIQGYEDGNFKPFEKINRAELLKILMEASEIEIQTPESNCFPDVYYKEWYAPYICTAKTLELINGYPDGTFKPEQNINKVESIKMLGEIFEWDTESTKDNEIFSDTSENEWFSPYIKFAKTKNLLPEKERYYPENNITRGNISETLYRFLTMGKPDYEDFEVISIDGKITDAQTGKGVEGVKITLSKESGETIIEKESDKEGTFEFIDVPTFSKDYISFSKDGYFETKEIVENLKNKFTHIPISKTFNQDSPEILRIILTWGKSETDLDAHLLTPKEEEIFFMYRLDSELKTILDISSTGSIGTETITIKEIKPGEYEYFVHNYSKEKTFKEADPKIYIYNKDGLKKTYSPQEEEGEIWKVFEIDEKGLIKDINEVGTCELIEQHSSVCP